MLQTGNPQVDASPQLQSLLRFVVDQREVSQSSKSLRRKRQREMDYKYNDTI